MSLQSFKKKHLAPVPRRDRWRYNIHAWVDIDGLALHVCKDDEEGKDLIRSMVKTIDSRVKELIAADLKELEKEKKK